jgi:hypothetical protein
MPQVVGRPPPGQKGKPRAPGSGRQKGALNRYSGEMRELAKGYGPKVIEGLWQIFETGDTASARVAAGRELLDRGYGRPAQAVTGADEGPVTIKHIVTWLK